MKQLFRIQSRIDVAMFGAYMNQDSRPDYQGGVTPA